MSPRHHLHPPWELWYRQHIKDDDHIETSTAACSSKLRFSFKQGHHLELLIYHDTPPTMTTMTTTSVITNVRLTTCACGRYIQQSLEKCTACARQLQRSLSQQQSRQLTPPPSIPAAPRRETTTQKRSRPTTPSGRVEQPSQAVIALNNAFAAEDDNLPSFFAKSVHRCERNNDATAAPRIRRPQARPSGPASTSDRSTSCSVEASPSASPMEWSARENSYAPMAAAFVRVARSMHAEESSVEQAVSELKVNARPTLELESRLFDGPA